MYVYVYVYVNVHVYVYVLVLYGILRFMKRKSHGAEAQSLRRSELALGLGPGWDFGLRALRFGIGIKSFFVYPKILFSF